MRNVSYVFPDGIPDSKNRGPFKLKSHHIAGAGIATTGAVLLAQQPADAQVDPVADMTAGVASLGAIGDTASGIAIAVTIFSVAALLVKRYLFA